MAVGDRIQPSLGAGFSDAVSTDDTVDALGFKGAAKIVQIGGTGTSATQVQGTAADGAAAVGSPVQIAGKDGSGNIQAIAVNTDGELVVNLEASAIEIGEVSFDRDTPGTTNSVAIITGQDGVAGGTGVDGATVPRVTLATNVALPAGANAIGKLAANSGVDIGDVDVTSSALPSGASTSAKQDTQITAEQAILAKIIAAPATEAKQDTGNTSLGTLVTQTDGIEGSVDGIEALLGGTGAVKDNGANWTSVFGVSGAVFTSADATTAAAVTDAPSGGQKLVITDIIASSDTAMFLIFEIETTGTDLLKVFIPANGTVQITPRSKLKLATADKKLMVDASATGNIAVTAFYYSEA